MLSFGGHYGSAAQKKAFRLLEANDYAYLGTAAHKTEHFKVLKNIKVEQKYEKAIEKLIQHTKQQMLLK
jgi:mannitol/fructose-specific phosphotransferase system IIA component